MVEERALAEAVAQWRSYAESEKQWRARRAFIERNLPGFQQRPRQTDQLLALSMVWANHVFMGCRYSRELLERVLHMAEGIEVEDAPHFTTRDEIMKQHQ
ncbi:CDKN2AIP N-terminal-like protein isoform X2 [Rhinatrema bivittatum]|uniref:CDKN2AIP N-terminal-like protein isoform X2 n=1 Tax=Rhinatrema bivittatum TaxID=194408 RepID=UPI00112C7FF1|nr:CDKN2AIP N-terminal-like protein isoform X2 [Rhinatrema bivittatum]